MSNTKLKKGSTYLVQCTPYWYVVQQSGQRSWVATCFTHVMHNHDLAHFHGNSTTLLPMIGKTHDKAYEVTRFDVNQGLRQAMFNVLKYGEIRHEET